MRIPFTSFIIKHLRSVIVVAVFSATGSAILFTSNAAPFARSAEAEQGQRSIDVQTISDSNASNGAAVRFANSPPFVTREGSMFKLAGQTFRFGGANAYWLGLDDNLRDGSGNPTYPTHARINDAFDEAAALKLRVIRAHSLGISVGCPTCLEPTLNTYNDQAFETIDYSIAQAASRGIKLIIPLTDQWRYYHGGKWNFVHWAAQTNPESIRDTNPDTSKNAGNDWNGASSEKSLEQQFYTSPIVQGYFRDYVARLLNHVNQYTGIALKDEPAILAWETGNELFDAPPEWTQSTASYIKHTLSAKQLVADGSAAGGNHTSNAALDAPDIDIVGTHFYNWPSGLDTTWLADDARTAAQYQKAYVAGEWGWSLPNSSAFISAIEANSSVSGDLFWVLLPHKEDGSPEPHGSLSYGSDDVPLYVPGIDGTMSAAVDILKAHATRMGSTQ